MRTTWLRAPSSRNSRAIGDWPLDRRRAAGGSPRSAPAAVASRYPDALAAVFDACRHPCADHAARCDEDPHVATVVQTPADLVARRLHTLDVVSGDDHASHARFVAALVVAATLVRVDVDGANGRPSDTHRFDGFVAVFMTVAMAPHETQVVGKGRS